MTTDYYARGVSTIWHKLPRSSVFRRVYGKQSWEFSLEAKAGALARCGRKPASSAVGEWLHVAASLGDPSRVCKDCERLG